MLGPSISALAVPLAIVHGLGARRQAGRARTMAVLGAILGMFSGIIPAAFLFSRIVAFVAPPVLPPDLRPVARDCATVAPITGELRLVAEDAPGAAAAHAFPRRGGPRSHESPRLDVPQSQASPMPSPSVSA